MTGPAFLAAALCIGLIDAGDPASRSVRELASAFVEAFNRRDAAQAAAYYTDQAEAVDRYGRVFHGRAAIQRELETFFAHYAGARLEHGTVRVRRIGTGVVMEEGRNRLTLPGADPQRRAYTAVLVRDGDRWAIASVQDAGPACPAPGSEPLDGLAWMIGQWVVAHDDGVTSVLSDWFPGRKFIRRTLATYRRGRTPVEAAEFIGWDPAAKIIRSWRFESGGAFSEAQWSPQAGGWSVHVVRTDVDGSRGSEVVTYRPVDANRYSSNEASSGNKGRRGQAAEVITAIRNQPKR
jgi:uncharacterized protein (TIGR02246 family)